MPREHERESSGKTNEHESRVDMYWTGAVLRGKRLENILLWTRTRVVCLSIGSSQALRICSKRRLCSFYFNTGLNSGTLMLARQGRSHLSTNPTRLTIIDLERQKTERTANKAYINVQKDTYVVMRAIMGDSIRLPGASCAPTTKTQPNKDDLGSRPQCLPSGEQKSSE